MLQKKRKEELEGNVERQEIYAITRNHILKYSNQGQAW